MASVFEQGEFKVERYEIQKNDPSSPPTSLLIVTPTQAGSYPVIVFLHGFDLNGTDYVQMLEHIASHGYILVAPHMPLLSGDVESAAAVSDWLPKGLQATLPKGVEADLTKLVLSGHSKGGLIAFALALKYAVTSVKYSVLVGIDPVAGFESLFCTSVEVDPKILTHQPDSLDINMPVLVIGSGLGPKGVLPCLPSCAPKGLNAAEFFWECKAPCYYFVLKNYGHLDMLDDAPFLNLARHICKCGEDSGRDLVRRTIGGLLVAFLEAYLDEKWGSLNAVVDDPSIAPVTLNPVQKKPPTRTDAISRL